MGLLPYFNSGSSSWSWALGLVFTKFFKLLRDQVYILISTWSNVLHFSVLWFFSEEVDNRWTRMVNTLAGQFCASFNQLGRTLPTIPRWSFRPLGSVDANALGLETPPLSRPPAKSSNSNSPPEQKSGRLLGDDLEIPVSGPGSNWLEPLFVSPRSPRPQYHRYGALPAEAVCTENLTPFRKLLPCTRSVRCDTIATVQYSTRSLCLNSPVSFSFD